MIHSARQILRPPHLVPRTRQSRALHRTAHRSADPPVPFPPPCRQRKKEKVQALQHNVDALQMQLERVSFLESQCDSLRGTVGSLRDT